MKNEIKCETWPPRFEGKVNTDLNGAIQVTGEESWSVERSGVGGKGKVIQGKGNHRQLPELVRQQISCNKGFTPN